MRQRKADKTGFEKSTMTNLLEKSGLRLARQFFQLQRPIKGLWRKLTAPRMLSAQSLSDKDFLKLFDLEEVAEFLRQDDVGQAKETVFAHYGSRAKERWPDFPCFLEEVSKLLENHSRLQEATSLSELPNDWANQSWPEFPSLHPATWQKLIDWADLVLENRFVLGGLSEVAMKDKVDWHYIPNSDPQWSWTLNRYEWLPLLIQVYVQTGDERYATKLVNLIADWIDANLPPPQKDETSLTWRLMEVGMRMYLAWVPAFGLLYHTSAFTDEIKLKMLRAICDHARFLSCFKTNRNHLLRESIGLAYVGIYFPEFKEAKQWRQIAFSRLEQELARQVNRDGSHIEMATAYQWLVIQEYQHVYDLLQNTGYSLPEEDLGAWLENMYGVLVRLIRPNYIFPQLNDGFTDPNHMLLHKLTGAGETFKRDDFVYAGTRGSRGKSPPDTSAALDDAGLYVMRSDWTQDARYLLFDAGPYGGPHGHEDKLNFELYAFGQSFIIDPGTYTYNQANPYRVYFVSSAGHNVITVDGKSQIRRWQKENLNPQPVQGNYATWISQADFDYVVATYDEGYADFSFKSPEEVAIENVSHTRHILFVKPDYWLVIDEIQADAVHNYQLLFHSPPGINATVESDNRIILGITSDGPRLHLIPAEQGKVRATWVKGNEDPIQGWCASPSYNVKSPAVTVVYEIENRASTVIATLLYPCRAGQTADLVTIKPVPVSGGQGVAFEVRTARGKDYLMLSPDDSLKQFCSYQSRGTVAGIRTDNKGQILSQFSSACHP